MLHVQEKIMQIGSTLVIGHKNCHVNLMKESEYRMIAHRSPSSLLDSGTHAKRTAAITNSIALCPPWNAESYSASQECPRILWNLKAHPMCRRPRLSSIT
jgi:hypothetical protein